MNNMYEPQKVVNWIVPIVYILIGLAFVTIPSDTLLNIIFTVLGIIIILLNLFPCVYYFMLGSKDNKYYTNAILSLVSVVIGFVFIFNHNAVIAVILGIWLVVLPILRIILSSEKKKELKKAIPYFIAAIILFFIPATTILDIVLKVFGVLLMILGIIYIIYNILQDKKKNKDDDNNDESKRDIINVEYKEL